MKPPRRCALASIPFLVVLATACSASPTPTPTPAPVPADGGGGVDQPWAATAVEHRGNDGQQYDYDCPAGGEAHIVWGTDVYTDDSSVCTAAVHVGEITLEDGGSVTVEIQDGLDSYEGSERNGIEASEYPSWPGSFVIVSD